MPTLRESMLTSTQMDGQPAEEQLLKAVRHTLNQIMTNPTLAYCCGIGTETFSLLTEAYAKATRRGVESVRKEVLSGIQKIQNAGSAGEEATG